MPKQKRHGVTSDERLPDYVTKLPIGWDGIKQQFQLIKGLLPDFSLLTQDVIDAYRAHLVAPNLFASLVPTYFEDGGFALPEEKSQRDQAIDALKVLGFLQTNSPDEPNHMDVCARAIAGQRLDLEFLSSWGMVQRAVAVFRMTCFDRREGNERQFLVQQRAAVIDDTTLQRYWYAHWIAATDGLTNSELKLDAEGDLAEVCADIVLGKLKASVFDASWYDRMIKFDDQREPILSKTYTRMQRDEIRRLVGNRHIPVSKLPPLARKGFTQC